MHWSKENKSKSLNDFLIIVITVAEWNHGKFYSLYLFHNYVFLLHSVLLVGKKTKHAIYFKYLKSIFKCYLYVTLPVLPSHIFGSEKLKMWTPHPTCFTPEQRKQVSMGRETGRVSELVQMLWWSDKKPGHLAHSLIAILIITRNFTNN
jgi:hypothetical protein